MNGCKECDAWWDARAAAWKPNSLPASGLTLVIEPRVDDEKQCHDCGWRADDPYGLISAVDIAKRQRIVRCSTCAAQRGEEWRQTKLLEQHERQDGFLPAVCECGYLLKDCQVHLNDCGGLPDLTIQHKKDKQFSLKFLPSNGNSGKNGKSH